MNPVRVWASRPKITLTHRTNPSSLATFPRQPTVSLRHRLPKEVRRAYRKKTCISSSPVGSGGSSAAVRRWPVNLKTPRRSYPIKPSHLGTSANSISLRKSKKLKLTKRIGLRTSYWLCRSRQGSRNSKKFRNRRITTLTWPGTKIRQ